MGDLQALQQLIARRRGSTTGGADPRPDALALIRRFIPFDAHVWLLSDPVTTVGGAPHADVPCLPELPALIRGKYLTAVNRWTGLTARPARVDSLIRATGGNPGSSLVWRSVQSRYRITDVASVVLTDRFGCWGFVDLWRIDAPHFSDTELDLLAGVVGPLTGWLRDHQAATFRALPEVGQPPQPPRGSSVVLVDDGLQLSSFTPAGAEWLRQLLPPGGGSSVVPASVYNVAAQLLAVEEGVDDHPASTRVHLPGGTWLTLRASRLHGAAGIAVTIEESSVADRLDLFCRAFGLSPRESRIVDQLAAGNDTRSVAAAIHLSEHTVQDHLKSVFAKTGIHNRRSLLSRALGTGRG